MRRRHIPKGLHRVPDNATDYARKRCKHAWGAVRARARLETRRAVHD